MSEQDNEELIYRINPPSFPMGFRLGVSKEICIIDFLDMPDENVRKVSYSIALTKETAQDLIDGLKRFVSDEK